MYSLLWQYNTSQANDCSATINCQETKHSTTARNASLKSFFPQKRSHRL